MDEYDGSDFRRDGLRRHEAEFKPWLMIWFRCCGTYGRIYRNRERTAYVGRCPKCGSKVRARIGRGGTSRRLFEAR